MDRLIIDVREPSEYAGGHVNGAVNIPLMDLMNGTDKLSDISKDARIILYCQSGSRSNMAGNVMRGLGYTNVTCLMNKEHYQDIYGDD